MNMPKPDRIDEFPAFVAEIFLPPGYPRLASRMETRPETAIFRRFGGLRSRLLLYKQAELIDLETQLCNLERSNSQDEKHSSYNRDYMSMIKKQESEERSKAQIALLETISQKLKDYDKLLIRSQSVLAMDDPNDYNLDYIRCFLAGIEMKDGGLIGRDAHTWGTITHPQCGALDLVSLQGGIGNDPLPRWVREKLLYSLGAHGFTKPSKAHGQRVIDEKPIHRIAQGITVCIAALLSTLSTIVLYFIVSMRLKLALIVVFNMIGSLCLCLIAKVKVPEVIAISAAYSAVQVVFVSNSNRTVPIAQ